MPRMKLTHLPSTKCMEAYGSVSPSLDDTIEPNSAVRFSQRYLDSSCGTKSNTIEKAVVQLYPDYSEAIRGTSMLFSRYLERSS